MGTTFMVASICESIWCRASSQRWGPGSREDQALLGHILPHPDLGSLRIAVFYETVGLTNQFTDYSAVSGHISHLAANYFDDPHYLKIDGRPVLFIYLTRVLAHEGRLADTMATIRSAAKASGHDLYLVGDQAFGTPAGPPATFNGLDAITNYDVYGSMEAHGHAGQAAVDAYFAAQDQWERWQTKQGSTTCRLSLPASTTLGCGKATIHCPGG
jgi:hypothetical protein